MTTRIGFSTTDGPMSRLIRAATKAEVSHTFFVYWDLDFRLDMVMEADVTGFRVLPLERFAKQNRVINLVQPNTNIDLGVREVARRYLGAQYDVGGLLGMAGVLRGLRNPLQNSRSVFCSEAVAFAMQFAGYPGTERWVPAELTPSAILAFFKER